MGTGSFPGVKYGRGVLLTTHPLLVPWSWKSRAIPLPTLWATTGPVTGSLYLLFDPYYCEINTAVLCESYDFRQENSSAVKSTPYENINPIFSMLILLLSQL